MKRKLWRTLFVCILKQFFKKTKERNKKEENSRHKMRLKKRAPPVER